MTVTIATTARQTSEMHASTISDRDATTARDPWHDANTRGLALAAEGAWSQAVDVWTLAVEETTADEHAASHDALALLLNNLAHASFRAGRVDEGIRHAQRACALRTALLGDDAIAVSRARADLAVMLGAAGRADEGLMVIARAIAGIELAAGDEDMLLATVLENAARLSMAAGQPSTAEPYLIRLHALLAEHGQPTYAADVLLARLMAHRRTTSVFHELELVDDETKSNPGVLPSSNALGFRVEYGTPIESETPRGHDQIDAPPMSTHVPTPSDALAVVQTPASTLPTHATPTASDGPVRTPRVLRRPRLRFG